MADLKISQLTGATTPLAGAEVVPVVQSGITKKVSVANLTAGRVVEMLRGNIEGAYDAAAPSTSSVPIFRVNEGGAVSLWVSGQGYSSMWLQAIQDDGSNNLKQMVLQPLGGGVAIGGDATLNTGNIIQGTAAKGFNFTANTGAAGKTSNLLNWYEEGTWTPTDGSGAGLTFTNVTAKYTRIGRAVTITLSLTYPTTADASQAKISGLPFAVSNFGLILFLTPGNVNGNGQAFIGASGTTLDLYAQNGAIKTNANMTAAQPVFTGTYFV